MLRVLNGVIVAAALAALAAGVIVAVGERQGLQLPVADQAGPPESSTEFLAEIPASWNDNITAARADFARQCKALDSRTEAARDKYLGALPMLTLRMDRRVEFGVFQEALRDCPATSGCLGIQIACRHTTGREPGYLILRWPGHPRVDSLLKLTGLPSRGSREADLKPSVACRISIDRVDGQRVYVVHTRSPYDANDPGNRTLKTLAEVEDSVREGKAKSPRMLLVIGAPADVPVQAFIDVFNAAVKAGCENVAVAKPQ